MVNHEQSDIACQVTDLFALLFRLFGDLVAYHEVCFSPLYLMSPMPLSFWFALFLIPRT
jgi:hypothetical protein